MFLSSADCLHNIVSSSNITLQEYHKSIQRFGFKSGPTSPRAWSGPKLFSRVISRRHLQAKSSDGNRDLLKGKKEHQFAIIDVLRNRRQN